MTRIGPWVQPDDLQLFTLPTYVNGSQRNNFFDDPDDLVNKNGAYLLNAPDNYPFAGTTALGFRLVQSAVMYFNVLTLASDAVTSPDLPYPIGATGLEFEADIGTFLDADPVELSGVGYSGKDATAGGVTSYGASIQGYPQEGYSYVGGVPMLETSPGDDPDIWTLYGGGTVYQSFPAPNAQPGGTSEPVAYDCEVTEPLDSEGWAAVMVKFEASFATVLATYGSGAGTYGGGIQAFDLRGAGTVDGGTHPALSAWFRPPRYRFIFAGRTPLRGRQRASGVIGSVPLRGRQGDKWGLRGRQNSNL